ncbi:MAG: RDD family protein [Nocardioidaceae bacterium]|nr:RDD family protein [Nocardioidaceae bacterium]
MTTASWLRRIGALIVDWAASSLVAAFIVGGFDEPAYQWLPLIVFWLESSVGVALAGGSFGQLLVRIRVHQTNGRPLNLLKALLRQLLVCLVIPPLVFKEDGRGLHDLATDSAAYEFAVRR